MMFLFLLAGLCWSVSGECVDKHRYCPVWAESGWCDPRVDNGFVGPNCEKSCGSCTSQTEDYLSMVKPLQSMTVKEGQSLLLEARAQGSPRPHAIIEFTKGDGYRNVLDTTVSTGADGVVIVSYHIPEIRLSEAGVYIATFANGHTREETRAIVEVAERVPELVILRGLSQQTINHGEFLELEVEVECGEVPEHSELYHYEGSEWVRVEDFHLQPSVRGRFIGRYEVVAATSAHGGDYMFTVGTKHLMRKSFGKVTVLTKKVLLEFAREQENMTIVHGESLDWSADIDYYPAQPRILVYRVKNYLWTRIDSGVRVGVVATNRTMAEESGDDEGVRPTRLRVHHYKQIATHQDEGEYILIVAGNGLNRKSTFYVRVEEPPTAKNEVTEQPSPFLDNALQDSPRRDTPRFIRELRNATAAKGERVTLTAVAMSSIEAFTISLYKVNREEGSKGEQRLLASAAPTLYSNYLNLTYVIDSLQPYQTGFYRAVLRVSTGTGGGSLYRVAESIATVNLEEEEEDEED